MTPPDRMKRPSARPAVRRASTPPAEVPVERAQAEVSAPAANTSKRSTSKKKPKARVSARRPSVAPPAGVVVTPSAAAMTPAPVTPAAAAAPATVVTTPAAAVAMAAAAVKTPAAPIAISVESVRTATSQPKSVGSRGAANAAAHEHDDDADLFGDSGAVPMASLSAYPPPAELADSESTRSPVRGRERLTKSSSGERRRDEVAMVGSAQQLDSSDYYFRQYGAHAIRNLSAEVDDFGLDPHFEERARPALEALVKRYFRVDVDGADLLPQSGRALIVANHAGALPWDGLVLRTALRVARPTLPPVRWLAEDTVFHYPFLGVTMNRLGAVRACQENAERLLSQDRLVAVFPEGAQGSSKLFKDRYRLQRFGRGGYVKLALKLGAPIIPTAIIGAEETNPLLARVSNIGRSLGANFLPITPTFPWFGPLGLLPAPVKWRVVVGEPIDLSSYGEHSADDALVVHRLNEQIRSILQALVDQAKASRRSVLFG